MRRSPSPNGRDGRGRFVHGNRGGPGNPHGGQAARFRARLHAAVTDDDFDAIARALITQAVEGDMHAIRELLNRLIGRATDADIIERVEALEAALGPTSDGGHP